MADRQTELLEEILAEQKALRGDVQDLKQGQAETNKRLTALEQGQKTLEHRQETLEHGIGALSVALQKHSTTTEEKLEDLQKTLTGFMSDAYDLHDKRITTLEEEVGIKPRKH